MPTPKTEAARKRQAAKAAEKAERAYRRARRVPRKLLNAPQDVVDAWLKKNMRASQAAMDHAWYVDAMFDDAMAREFDKQFGPPEAGAELPPELAYLAEGIEEEKARVEKLPLIERLRWAFDWGVMSAVEYQKRAVRARLDNGAAAQRGRPKHPDADEVVRAVLKYQRETGATERKAAEHGAKIHDVSAGTIRDWLRKAKKK